MKQERNENAEDLDQKQIRNIVDLLNCLFECRLAVHRFRIREHVHEEEKPERNDAGDLVKFP